MQSGAEPSLRCHGFVRKMLFSKDLRFYFRVFSGLPRRQMILKLVEAPAAGMLPARSVTPVRTKDRV